MHKEAAWAFTLLLFVAASRVEGLNAAPKVVIDVAKQPEDRWGDALKLVVATHGWEYSLGPGIDLVSMLHMVLPAQTFVALESVVRERFPTHYREMKGLANALADIGYPQYANITFLIVIPFMYELQHINVSSELGRRLQSILPYRRACTGILSLPEERSKSMIHGRNLDESPRAMRNLTLDITVVNNGTYLYSVFDYTWITTGFYTASRVSPASGLTLEENWRDYDDPSFEALMQRIESDLSFVPVAFLFRSVMDNALSFDDAVHYITANVTLAAPGYVIMSGPHRRGAILTLYRDKDQNVREYLSDESSVTFKVQTNYDRWLPDPPTDPRRTVAENALSMLSAKRRGSPWGVWMALSTYPVHNPQTLFSAIMRSNEETEGFVRQSMVPETD